MSSEMMQAAAETIKNANILSKAKDIATAHPVGAAVAGTVVAGLAVIGGYKVLSKLFGCSDKSDK